MAEMIFKDLIYKNNKKYMFNCKSRATSIEEIGNGIYPKALEKLKQMNVKVENHKATKLTKDDYEECDFLIVMEEANIADVKKIIGEDKENKIHRLREFTDCCKDIDDPWYTGDFETAYNDIYEGCLGLYNYLLERGMKDGKEI